MTTDDFDDILQSDDAFVLLRPVIDEETGMWSGEVALSLGGVFVEGESNLSSTQRGQLMSLTALIASALPVMDEHDDVYQKLLAHVEATAPDIVDEIVEGVDDEPEQPIYTKDGNVLTLDFNTPTKGSA